MDSNARQAFEQIKKLAAEHAVLAFPKHDAPTSLTTDASTSGIGAVLQQLQDDKWRPLAFFSKSLSGAQTKYSPFDLKLLAAYEAVKPPPL